MADHATRKHAMLSASGASRWLNCPPSAKLESELPERPTSVYAAEGTLAHEISELFIKHDVLNSISDDEFNLELERLMSNELFSEEMLDVLPIYVDYCETEYNVAKAENKYALIEIEQKLDIRRFVPEGFGTADCVIINDDELEVIDLKYGKGVPVYAEHNNQGMLYALGALMKYDTFYDIARVKISIVQPRINNISSWTVGVSELLEWAETTLKPIAKIAFEGGGEFKAGPWCKFCSIKNRCRALSEEQLSVAKYEFKAPDFLSDEEISDIMTRAPQFQEWINSVVEYANSKAIKENKIWPGYKLVHSVSRRKWDDEDKVITAIYARIPEATEDQILTTKLKSITELEKVFGKKRISESLGDVIIKPEGKPTLVPNSDKRPAIGVEEAISDFK